MTDHGNKEDNVTQLAKLINMDENVIRATSLPAEKIESLFSEASGSKKYRDRLMWPGFFVALAGAVLIAFPEVPPMVMLSLITTGGLAELAGGLKDNRSGLKEEIIKAANDRLVELSRQPSVSPRP